VGEPGDNLREGTSRWIRLAVVIRPPALDSPGVIDAATKGAAAAYRLKGTGRRICLTGFI
jgi:hypothetical protein